MCTFIIANKIQLCCSMYLTNKKENNPAYNTFLLFFPYLCYLKKYNWFWLFFDELKIDKYQLSTSTFNRDAGECIYRKNRVVHLPLSTSLSKREKGIRQIWNQHIYVLLFLNHYFWNWLLSIKYITLYISAIDLSPFTLIDANICFLFKRKTKNFVQPSGT